MVARTGPSLRLSVRHKDSNVAPPRTKNDERKFCTSDAVPTPTTTTTAETNDNPQHYAIQNTRNTTKVSNRHHSNNISNNYAIAKTQSQKPPRSSPPPPLSPHPVTETDVPGHERPRKRAKLDTHAHEVSNTTTGTTTTTTAPAKFPLRNRDSQGLPASESTTATRARSKQAINTRPPVTLVPPRSPSPASAIPRNTWRSGHNALVSVNEDAQNKSLSGDPVNHDFLNAPSTAAAISDTSAPTAATRERRSLRSNDGGSRSRSELALYFQNYEQILSLEPVKPGELLIFLFFFFLSLRKKKPLICIWFDCTVSFLLFVTYKQQNLDFMP